MGNVHVYYKSSDGKKADIEYKHVTAVRAGTALQILGRDDCRGNGIRESAPVITLYFDDGEQATFDADNVTLLL